MTKETKEYKEHITKIVMVNETNKPKSNASRNKEPNIQRGAYDQTG